MIDQYPYVDARAKKLDCNYFADEVILVYENSKTFDIECRFSGCFKVAFDHAKKYDKLRPVKDMTYAQMPYFMFDISVTNLIHDDEEFYCCKLDMGLLELEIWCKDVHLKKIDAIDTYDKICYEF